MVPAHRTIAPLLLLLPTALAQTPASVEGQVLDALTGAPVRKALLTLISKNPSRPPITVDTDTTGHFRFANLPPGDYSLAAGARGYLLLSEDTARQPLRENTRFTLAPSQALAGLVLRITPFAAISGQVLDEDGDPIAGAKIEIWHTTYRNWVRELATEIDDKGATDDRGVFRVAGLPPGRYYLSATPGRSVRNWYPGVLDPTAALPIDLAPGAELELTRLKLSRVETISIRGRVIAHAPANVLICPDGIIAYGESCVTATSNPPDGSFSFDGFLPGVYHLLVTTRGVAAATHRVLTVGATGVDNLTLQPTPAVAIQGHIRVDGKNDPPNLAQTRLWFIPLYVIPSLSGFEPTLRSGAFSLSSVNSGRYQIVTANLPPDLYFPSTSIELPPARPLEIVLHPNAARITGTVVDDDAPVPESTIVLVPQEPDRRADPFAYVKATTDTHGRFSVQSLPPGEYKAYAWPALPWTTLRDQLYLDPDFLSPYESRGTPLSLHENDHPEIKLPLLK